MDFGSNARALRKFTSKRISAGLCGGKDSQDAERTWLPAPRSAGPCVADSCRMARPTGFEPMTPGLGILCSILLSYGRPNGFVSGLVPIRQGTVLAGLVLSLTILVRPASALEIAAGGGIHLDGRDVILADVVVPTSTEVDDAAEWHIAASRGHDRWQRELVAVNDRAGSSLATALVESAPPSSLRTPGTRAWRNAWRPRQALGKNAWACRRSADGACRMPTMSMVPWATSCSWQDGH